MRTWAFLVTLALIATSGWWISGAQERKEPPKRLKLDPKKIQDLMHKKLLTSQTILEGITKNDYKMIGKGAEDLIDISKQIEFMVVRSPQYESFSNDFRRSAEALAKMAKDENIDGASFTYLEMSLNCFNCHRYIRDLGKIRLDQ
jgi:hypothetical protein